MYCKLNLNVKYPPPYEHLVLDYNKANVEGIKKSIESESVTWELMFSDKTVHKQVSIFNQTLINIFSNFTSNKLVTFKGCVHYIFASLFLRLNEGTSQTRENAFYFNLKALFVLEKIKF